eukprot:10044466-Karenia_brevis.AAC.1
MSVTIVRGSPTMGQTHPKSCLHTKVAISGLPAFGIRHLLTLTFMTTEVCHRGNQTQSDIHDGRFCEEEAP